MKKYIFCVVFCMMSLCCTGCEIEPAESPDTLEGILNLPSPQPETTAETRTAHPESESETEYHSIFFNFDSETEPVTEEITEPSTEETTESPTEETTELPTEETTAETEPVTEMTEMPSVSADWRQAYAAFLRNGSYQKTLSEQTQEEDLKFSLLYLDEDDVPELALQTLSIVLFYSCRNQQIVLVDAFSTSRYSYEFYYRPYHNAVAAMQGSVMADGTYWEVHEYHSALSFKAAYCYPTRESSYAVYAEQGMNIDLEKVSALDISLNQTNMLGASWVAVPDILQSSPSVRRYDLTEEEIAAAFGLEEQETTETTGV